MVTPTDTGARRACLPPSVTSDRRARSSRLALLDYNRVVVRGIVVLVAVGVLTVGLGGASGELDIETSARAVQPGEVVLLTARAPQSIDRLQVSAFGRGMAAFPIDGRTWRAVVGIDLAVKPGPYPVTFEWVIEGRRTTQRTMLAVRARKFPTRTLRVDNAFVNPGPKALARINSDAAALRALWTQSSATRLWTETFVRPVQAPANSAFGSRSVFNGQARQPHAGADFPSPAGTPILSPNTGQVVLARDLYFTGNTVVIDHGLGLFSTFAHLSAINVREGAQVNRGETLGLVGATGRVTGPHLHWAVRVNEARVDPLALLAMLGAPDAAHAP